MSLTCPFQHDQELDFDRAVFLIYTYDLCAKATLEEFYSTVIPRVKNEVGWVEKCLNIALKNDNYPLVKHIAAAQPAFLRELLMNVIISDRKFDDITVWTLRKNEITKDLFPNEILWCEIDCIRHCFYSGRIDLIEIAIKRRKEMIDNGCLITPFTERNIKELKFLDRRFTKSHFEDIKWL